MRERTKRKQFEKKKKNGIEANIRIYVFEFGVINVVVKYQFGVINVV